MSNEVHELRQHAARLEFELGRVRETVENQFSRIEVLERRLSGKDLANQVGDLPAPSCDTEDGVLAFLKQSDERSQFYLESTNTGPLRGSPGLNCYSLKDKTNLVLGIAVFDQSIDALRRIVAMIAENQRRTRGFIPVFMSNTPDFSPFRAQKYLYEYLRTDASMAESLKNKKHCQFLQERFQFIMNKWGINMVIDLSKDTSNTQHTRSR